MKISSFIANLFKQKAAPKPAERSLFERAVQAEFEATRQYRDPETGAYARRNDLFIVAAFPNDNIGRNGFRGYETGFVSTHNLGNKNPFHRLGSCLPEHTHFLVLKLHQDFDRQWPVNAVKDKDDFYNARFIGQNVLMKTEHMFLEQLRKTLPNLKPEFSAGKTHKPPHLVVIRSGTSEILVPQPQEAPVPRPVLTVVANDGLS